MRNWETFRILATILLGPTAIRADDVQYRYEGDVLPQEAGWIAGDCSGPCRATIEDGRLAIEWSDLGAHVSYLHYIAAPDDPPPPLPAWIEWSFRSSEPKPPNLYTCDAAFSLQYHSVGDLVFLFADAVVSFDGGSGMLGLEPDRFHTSRFETTDGTTYRFSVDGLVFVNRIDNEWTGAHYVAIGSFGGCDYLRLPNVNEWDFVRYGTISYGEKIVAADPPAGFLRAEDFPALDRFTVRFEEPNYVYVDEVTVEIFPYPGHEGASLPYPDREGAAPDRHESTQPRSHEDEGIEGPRDQGIEAELRITNDELRNPQIGNRNSAIGNSPKDRGQQATGNSVGWAAPTDSDPSSLRPFVPSSLPAVSATRRLDNGPPDLVEIVLDKPIPLDARTVFTFDDGTIRQNVSYTYMLGDANADGRFDLRDMGEFQNCFFDEFAAGRCWAFDFDAAGYISLEDYPAFHPILAGP
jgi:hypothetical protein